MPLDTNVLKDLQELASESDPDLIKSIIVIYLEKAPQHIESLKKALSIADVSQIKFQSHSFKSSSGNVGALDLARYCGLLENSIKPLEEGQSLIGKIETEYLSLVPELKKLAV